MPETSEVRLIQKDSQSLRTTIPAGVRAALDLKPRDNLEWTINAEDSVVTVKLRKGRPSMTPQEINEWLANMKAKP